MTTLTPHSQPIKAVVFDFDGTLAMPTLDFGLMRQRVELALAPFMSPTHGPAAKNSPTPLPALEHINQVCAALPPTAANAARAAAMQAIEDVEVEAAARSRLFPDTVPMLVTLRAHGIAAGVITRNCRNAVLTVFPGIHLYTGCLLTRHDVPNVKPHPGHLLEALKRLGVAPEHALMVGDHPMDIITGKNAGTRTAGLTTGEAPYERLHQESPTFLAHGLDELLQHIVKR